MFSFLGALMLTLAMPSQATGPCLHGAGEYPSQRTRRIEAMAYLSHVNAAQARVRRDGGSFAPLSSLGLAAAPVGFVPRLTFDQWNYQISLKDVLDSCGFALFSDQDGVIYAAQPVTE